MSTVAGRLRTSPGLILRNRGAPAARRAIAALEGSAGWAVLAVAVVASIAVRLYFTRGTTFYYDELDLFESSKGFDAGALLAAHNGHFIFVPRLIYSVVFAFFGPNYAVFRLIEGLEIGLVGALVYVFARPRVGGALALAPAVVILFLASSGGDPTLSPNGIIICTSVLASAAAIVVLDLGGPKADAVACAALVVAVSSWSLGVPVALGAAVWILLRPRWRQRIWIAVLPLALYVLWYAFKSHFVAVATTAAVTPRLSNVFLVPNYVASGISATAASLTGLDFDFSQVNPVAITTAWGPPLAIAAAIGCFVRVRRTGPTPASWALAVSIGLFLTSVALAFTPLRIPEAGRYVFPTAVLGVMLLADVWRGVRIGPPAIAAVLVLAVFALGSNVMLLRNSGSALRAWTTPIRADLATLELARDRVRPGFVPSTGALADPLLGGSVTAGAYLAAVDQNGSFADTLPELRAAPEPVRQEAATVLAQADRLRLRPATRAPHGCRQFSPRRTSGAAVALPFGRPVLEASKPASLKLGRFGASPEATVGKLAPGRPKLLSLPHDAAPDPWYAAVQTSGSFEVCAA